MIKLKSHIVQLQPSDTLQINEKSKSLAAQGLKVYKFGFGQSPFPVPQIVQESLRQNTHQKDYLPVQGLLALRAQIARHTNSLIHTGSYTAEHVFIGPGSKELIFLTQLAVDAPLILPNPSWVSYAPQATINQKEIHWIPTAENNWQIDAAALDDYIQVHNLNSAIIILNDPSNPTGRHFNLQELKDLAAVCKKHQLLVISDEIYGLLRFDGGYHSIASYYPEGTIISSGLSKWCGAGGWRLGSFVIPDALSELTAALRSLASETFSAVSAPVQYAAVTAYTDHVELTEYRLHAIEILKLVARYCFDKLHQIGVQLCPADGGFYLFPNFDPWKNELEKVGIATAKDFCDRLLLEAGVALLPGSAFGQVLDTLTCRLSFVDFNGEQAMDHYKRHGNITSEEFDHLFPNIVQGIDALISWLNKLKI